MMPNKNEGCGGARARNSDSTADNIRSVRNDVSQSVRNVDNLNSSRNPGNSSRDVDREDVSQGINKRRLERIRGRKDGSGNLNNRDNFNL